jgi:hypothetical protein
MTGAEDRRLRLSLPLVLASLLFLASRLVLLYVRDPFFDELFTVWMARQPITNAIPVLMHDSGPPLYYFLARFDSVIALRWLSLLFAAIQFVLVARVSWQSALLLAVYPPAVLFAVDARAYALCAMLVTAALVSIREKPPYLPAVLLALAAYTHYYAVLFLPILLLAPDWRRRILPFGLALALVTPGFYLASQQPAAATGWIKEPLLLPLVNFSMAGRYPESLFAAAPSILVGLACALFAIARPVNAWSHLWVAAPILAALALHIAGRPVYFPMRFEAVLAGAVVLVPWRARRGYVAALAVIGAYVTVAGTIDHYRRPPDPYRQAAMALAQNVKPSDTIVATGYLYLETVMALDRAVVAWPKEQALHPGWRATGGATSELPKGEFVWIGERSAPELVRLREVRLLQPLFMNERAVVALTRPLH